VPVLETFVLGLKLLNEKKELRRKISINDIVKTAEINFAKVKAMTKIMTHLPQEPLLEILSEKKLIMLSLKLTLP
jgi:hypothetical protein